MLVSVDDLRSYMGGLQLDSGEAAEMAAIISGVQQDLENYLNRPVEPVQIRESLVSDNRGCVHLSVTPVLKVISYGVTTGTVTPTVVVPAPMERDESLAEDVRMINKQYDTTISTPGGLRLVWPYTNYTVEYIGGYNGYTDESLKLAIKRVAAREWATNHVGTAGLRGGLVEQTEVGDTRLLGWSSEELRRLQRHRRRLVL